MFVSALCVQCFRNGIGITVIEARGATIRDGKHKSFDLITPYKTFRYHQTLHHLVCVDRTAVQEKDLNLVDSAQDLNHVLTLL